MRCEKTEKTQLVFHELRSFWMPDYNYHYEIPEADLEAWSFCPINSGEVLIGSLSRVCHGSTMSRVPIILEGMNRSHKLYRSVYIIYIYRADSLNSLGPKIERMFKSSNLNDSAEVIAVDTNGKMDPNLIAGNASGPWRDLESHL